MTAQLDDPLNDLFVAAGSSASTEPRKLLAVPASYVPVEQRFEEKCPKCNGTGEWGYSRRTCFGCAGTGKKVFKTAPEARAKARIQAAERRAGTAYENLEAFKAREPQVFAWLITESEKATPFEFAVSMVKAIEQYGDLTEKQLETSRRLTAKAAERKSHSDNRVADAPTVNAKGVDRLKEAFDAAIAYSATKGLTKSPRITIGDLTIKPAKASSANPGALYVTEGDAYLGKITGGRFFASAACLPGRQERIIDLIADPKSAAEVYGRETGVCCVCNATLTSEWRLRGIGPICSEKFGWGA